MPHENSTARILVRDGYICSYCGHRLYSAQAIKCFDMLDPGLNYYDKHGRREPLRRWWATVDHVIPASEGGTDCIDNLVACCVSCKSSKKVGVKILTPDEKEAGWLGYADIYLALVPMLKPRLSNADRKWEKALVWAGVSPSPDDPYYAIAVLKAEYGKLA